MGDFGGSGKRAEKIVESYLPLSKRGTEEYHEEVERIKKYILEGNKMSNIHTPVTRGLVDGDCKM